ncbi:MAG: HAMP domain-containing histidine kinase [Lachnospiraceae bacterium]|nr:HAMP domain-containing histidine kinase [Lachnospiraceae bacterium]
MKNGRKIGKTIRAYVLIEVFALAVAAVFLVGKYYAAKSSVRSEIEACLPQLYDAASEARSGIEDGALLSEPMTLHIEAGEESQDVQGVPQIVSSMTGLRLSGAKEIWDFLYCLQRDEEILNGLETSFYGCVNVAVYTTCSDSASVSVSDDIEAQSKAGRLFLNGNIAVISYRIAEDKTIVWDLTKYFPEDKINELMENTFSESAVFTGLFYNTMDVVSLCVRETGDGELVPTRVSIRSFGHGYPCILQSEDYRETDTRIWLDPNETPWKTKDDVPEGTFQPGVDIIMISQNRELRDILAKPQHWAYLDTDRYYLAERSYTERSQKTRYGHDAELTLAQKEGMAIYSSSENIYPTAMSYYVLVDVNKVVWNRMGGLVVFTIAFAQTVAVIVMIIRSVWKRRKDEQEQLRNTFIGAMAHELRDPVDITRKTAGRLAEGVDPEERAQCLETLTQESVTMNDLLNRMLTYTRVMDGKVTLHEQMTDLGELVESVLPAYYEQLEAKRMKVKLVRTCPKEQLCDPDLMRTVMENILTNAVSYGEEDSILHIELNHAKVTVWNQTGSRLSEKDLKGIWTPLYEREQDGVRTTGGIGLAMCAGILRLHGARYGAYNEGMGLTVYFDFSNAKKTRTLRRFGWINLASSGMLLLTSYVWYAVYRAYGANWFRGDTYTITLEGGKLSGYNRPMWFLAVSCGFLVCAILFAWAYAKSAMPKLLRAKSPWKNDGQDGVNDDAEGGEI